MARINDLERGFEKTLAYAYGKHVVQGHLIMHNIDIIGSEKQVTLLMALGDGAYSNTGEGAWGVNAQIGTPGEGDWEGLSLSYGPDLFWRFDAEPPAANGDPIVDISGNNLDGQLVYTGSSPVEPYGYSSGILTDPDSREILIFNDPFISNSYVTMDSNSLIEYTGDFTLVALVRPVGLGHDLVVKLKNFDGNCYRIHFNTNGRFVGSITDSAGTVWTVVAPSSGSQDEFVGVSKLIHLVRTGNDLKIYVDGSLKATTVIASGLPTLDESGPLKVSANISGNYTFRMDEVLLYNRTLTPLEIYDQYLSTQLAVEVSGAVEAVYYGGRLISSSNWHYHPGTFSTGVNDPVQGVDSFFPGGITYSGTAYIAIRLPIGVADDADPSKLAIVLKTSCVADYDIEGNVTEISYSSNPARVKADMLKRRGLISRLNWDSFIQARDWYDATLDWESGDSVNTYTDVVQTTTWTLNGNIQGTTALSKISPVSAYDNVAKSEERIVYGQDGYCKVTISAAFPTFTAGGDFHLVDNNGKAWFGISWGNGHISFLANGVAIDDATIPYDYPATAPVVLEIGTDAGEFYFDQDGVRKTPPQGTSIVPVDTDLFARVVLYESTAAISSSEFKGQEIISSSLTTTEVSRFEAHPAFTSPVQLTDALDFVDSLCASETQDAGSEIIFITPATPSPRTSTFTFIEDENTVSVRVYYRDIRECPNRISGVFRDLGTVYLEENEVFESRDQLFDQVGYIIDPGALNFASMNSSQAQRLIKYQMRRLSDNRLFCDVQGMLDSFKLLPGDIVTVVSEKLPGGITAPKDFIVLECTRESGESSAYERSFVLQEWFSSDYSDDDHGPVQSSVTEPVPSPFDEPGAPVLLLSQETSDAGGVVTNKIIGDVHFGTYLYAQTAKIYVIVSGGSEVYTGIEISPVAGTNGAAFEYIASTLGEYQFRAEAISYTGVVGGSGIATITVGDFLIDEDSESLTEDGELLTEV